MLSRYKIGIRYSESEYGFPVLEVLRGRRLRVNEKAARARAKEEEAMDVDEVKDEIEEMEDIPMEDEAENDGNEVIEDLEQFRAWLWAVYFRDEFRSETSSSYQGERDMCRLARVALMAWRLDCISWQFSLVPRLVRFAVEPNPRLSQTTHTDTQIQSQTTQTTYISDCSLRFFPYLIDVLVLYQCYEYGFGVEQTRKKVEDKWVTRSFDLDEERGKEEDWGQEEKEHMKVIRYAEERGLKRLICEVLYEFVVRSSEIPSSGQLGALEIPKELALIPGYEENILRGVEALKIFWDWICTTVPSMFAGNPSSSCPFHDHRKRCVPALTRYWISAIDSVTRADEDSVLGKLGRKTSSERVRAYGNMVDVRMRLVKIWGSMAGYSREEERMKWVERQLRKDALVWEIKQGCSKQRRHELIAEVNIRRVKGARKECWDKGVEKIVEQFNALHDGWRLETFFFKDLEITKQVFATGEAKRNRSIQPAKYRIVMPGEEVRRLDQL
ncbi:hypothetical protein K435DRAFT_780122 [Dendrothele bispora CBS 962.96]|uniref:Uncharacterized protein n=1 Tax=Dendrothele bispora (strain CBS 962.96) TaxID=1314807 RepID=A0A4S8LTC4_DENBC|nr:hypothetical protein K435DRAFT_780122 [Dendrothele bispora CBS 962.96]